MDDLQSSSDGEQGPWSFSYKGDIDAMTGVRSLISLRQVYGNTHTAPHKRGTVAASIRATRPRFLPAVGRNEALRRRLKVFIKDLEGLD